MTTVINHNPISLIALNSLNKTNKNLARSVERLSTGFQINRASDGPAGLVISERLRAQVAGLKQAIDNSERAQNIIATAEAALIEINSLLISVQDLIIEASNDGALSTEEILANQAQVDDAIKTIDRISGTTNFAGLNLLNGGLGYVTSGVNSGVSGIAISEFDIQGAVLKDGSSVAVTVKVTQNASQAVVSTSSTVGQSGASILVQGNVGTELLVFNTSQAQSAVVAAVNAVSGNTGVVAKLSGLYAVFQSDEFGSDQTVQVQDISKVSPLSQYINDFDEGADIVGTINGITADGKGLKLSIDSFEIDGEFSLSHDYYANNASSPAAGVTSAASHTFHITNGGAKFKLGSGSNDADTEFIGISRVGSDNLGSREAGGFLSDLITGGIAALVTNAELAKKITEDAIDDITTLRARLGAFQANTLESNINTLNVSVENLQASESRIRDTDFAKETAEFAKFQILNQAGTAIAAQANLLPQGVLALLG